MDATKFKMCANAEMAIEILEFIKRNYEKHSEEAGVQKYIEALEMGIDALKNNDKCDVANEPILNVSCEHEWNYLGHFTAGKTFQCTKCGITKSSTTNNYPD